MNTTQNGSADTRRCEVDREGVAEQLQREQLIRLDPAQALQHRQACISAAKQEGVGQHVLGEGPHDKSERPENFA